MIISIILTAILSSLLTVAVGAWYIKRHYQQTIRPELDNLKREIGEEIEERVRKGVIDGVKGLSSKDVIRDTTMNLAKTGLDIFGTGLRLGPRGRGPLQPGDPLDPDED